MAHLEPGLGDKVAVGTFGMVRFSHQCKKHYDASPVAWYRMVVEMCGNAAGSIAC